MGWREMLLTATMEERAENSAQGMAAYRLMKSMGGKLKDLGAMCGRFGIAYDENQHPFVRAAQLFREVYPSARGVEIFDVRSGKDIFSMIDEIMSDPRTMILFFKSSLNGEMTTYVRGLKLSSGPLSGRVLRPGARYMAERDGVELWEQEPMTLLKSFSEREVTNNATRINGNTGRKRHGNGQGVLR